MAAIFSGMAYPLYRALLRRMNGRRPWASVSTIAVILVVVGLPLLALLGLVANQAVEVTQAAGPWIERQISEVGGLDRRLGDLPFLSDLPGLRSLFPKGEEIVGKVGEAVSAVGSFLVGSLADLTRGTLGFFLQFFILLYAMFFFLMDGRSILDRILSHVPLSRVDEERLLEKFVSVTRATLKGSLLIGIIQGGLAGVAFWLAGVPGAAFWGTVTVVVSIIPAIGAALIWGPVVIYLMLSGPAGAGLGLLLWSALVVSTIDNFLRPRLVGRDTRMSDLLILLSTLGGLLQVADYIAGFGDVAEAEVVSAIHPEGDGAQIDR
jgi:predicted PurR-regulated permease PerM